MMSSLQNYSCRHHTLRASLLLILSVLSVGCGRDSAAPEIRDSQTDDRSAGERTTPARPSWPFADAENTATITLKRIVDRTAPILFVSHDSDDGGWQFLDGGELTEADGTVVSLHSILEIDPTVKELADLPRGWQAEREAVGKPWGRKAVE